MADYSQQYPEIQSAGGSVAALSVDPPGESEALRIQLALPFPVLCDTERRIVKEWDVYNPAEKGGIAKPAVFIIDSSRTIRYAAVDTVVRRVPAVEIVSLLRRAAEEQPVRRKLHIPRFSDWKRALRNKK